MATTSQYNFTVTQLDLDFILKQIKFAEQSTVINPLTGQADVVNLANIISNGGSVTSAAVLPFGLRTVDGTWNNLLPGQERLGAADNIMPRLVALNLQAAEVRPAGLFAPTAGTVVTSYAQTSGNVYDTQPRVASNLISDQTANNPAAVAAALQLAGYTSAQITAEAVNIANLNRLLQAQNVLVKAAEAAILAATPLTLAAAQQAYIDLTAPSTTIPPFAGGTYTQAADTLAARLVLDGLTISDNGTIGILNLSPDIGLSPSFNSWMTIFGQFFDHGLDLVTKGGNGTVFVPLLPDDPLYVAGSQTNFMVLTRATQVAGPGADGILLDNPLTAVNEAADNTTHETINTTTPFIDQNQTYTSHPSHQVFLREYARVADGPDANLAMDIVATGRMLSNSTHSTHAAGTWADVKAQARDMLGIQLVDMDVHNVPLLATDRYGEFIRGPNGFAQMVTATGLVEGNPLANGGLGVPVPANAVRTDHAFLNDIAHGAAPGSFDAQPGPGVNMQPLLADSNTLVGSLPNPNFNPALPVGPNNLPVMPQAFGTYDNELLDRHFITGDGRGNENIGLTTVHTIFHSEHNRLVEDYKHTILASGNAAVVTEWLRSPGLLPAGPLPTTAAGIDALVLVLNASNAWDGERLFQAGRFVNEMQYQHMVFEEFARAVQPAINPFIFSNSPDIDPAIMAEFAHVVYRFGHSMLTENVNRIGANMQSNDIGLIAAFLNPVEFDRLGGVQVGVDVAMGAIVRGMSRDTGSEIDEFVTEALRNNLVGLPLDLAVLNMARARETGMPSFNEARAAFFAATGDAALKPLLSWASMTPELKNPTSIINFIAAYGTHGTILNASTLADKRAAATSLVFGNRDLNGDGDFTDPFETAAADRLDFLNSTGVWTAANSGLNDVDFWIGGLAERKNEFGGMLGATFDYVFKSQMEKLQNGDRFYYLSRTQGTNMLNELESNTFSKIIMRNTDLGAADSSHLSSLVFMTPNYTLELNQAKQVTGLGLTGRDDPVTDNPILQILHPMVIRVAPGVDGNGGFLQFTGGEHVVLGGTAGNDTLKGGNGIDTLWGDAGNDRLDGGNEADQVHGGDGDDIITDAGTPAGGADFLRGDEGNDVISAGMGNDLVFGGGGKDFLITGNDFTEVFAGRGDDFILGGVGPDTLLGNEGNDWIEGGDGFDGLAGENSELFFNSPIIGHDVLNGQGNDTDYDGESGDDIMIQTVGITRSNGMFGFDWASHKGDTVAANSDLGIPFFPAQAVFTLRDRFDSVEGLSGWNLNDTLTGTARLPVFAGPGNPADESALKSQNVSLINGLAELLGLDPVAIAALPVNTTVIDTTTGAEVIIGGGGSDTIRGNLGNDYLDGDAWLNTRIRVTNNVSDANTQANERFTVNSMNDIKARMLTGEINPGQLHIVREILQSATASTDVDTAVYNGLFSDYTVISNINGSITVTHNTIGLASDGSDTIRNFEKLQFSDRVVTLSAVAITGSPTEDQTLTADTAGVLGTVLSLQWFRNGVAIVGATNNTLLLGDADVGMRITVLANFTDLAGNVTLVVSRPSAPVININDVPVGVPSISGIVTEDQVLTVSTTGITDVDGLGAFSYQWTRGGVNIVGATGTTLTLGDADVGAVIAVVVRYTDLNGTLETLTSAATLPVVNVNDAPVGLPVISGMLTRGQVLTVSAAGITDADGLGAFSYQWTRGGVNIVGATGSTLTLGDADVGAVIAAVVSYTDLNGTVEVLTSAATLPVININSAPVGLPVISGIATEDQVLTVSTAGITDADGLGAFSYQWTRGGVNIVGATGSTLTLGDADVGAVIAAVVSYTDLYGMLETLTSAATAAVLNINDAPTIAATAAATVLEDGTITGIALGSDVDLGTVLSYSTGAATNGLASIDPVTGAWSYAPAANFNGTDSFVVTVSDGVLSATQTVTVTVTAVNDAPVGTATAVLAAGTEDTAYFVSFASLLAGFSDVDVATNGQVLSIANLVATNGTVAPSLDGLGYTITPTLNFNGTMGLTYNVIDGNLGSIAASQSYAVAAVNDAPVGTASAVLIAGTEDTAYVVSAASLLAGFSDVDTGDILSVSGLTANNGGVVLNADGISYTITPAPNFNGTMGLTYNVIDGNLGSIAASLSYAVTAVNNAPTGAATALLAAGTEDAPYFVSFASLLAGFSDVDVATNGQVLSIANLVAANGTVAPSLDGLGYTITPALNFNGTMALTYNVIDGNLGSIAASQSYAVTAVNDAPVLSGTQATLAGGTEDTAYVVSAASLLAGFSDVDTGDILSVSGLTASNGSVVLNADGLGYTITPTLNFNGTMGLTYSVIDGNLGSIAASLSYTVAAVNNAPVGTATAVLTAGTEDTAYFVSFASLLAGFSDVDVATNGQVLSVANLVATNGTVALSLDGLGYTITPTLNFNGAVSLGYDVIDGNLGSIAASQSYAVTAVNDAPVGTATAVLAAGTEDTAYTVSFTSLLAGFSDVDVATNGQVLSIANLVAANGTVAPSLDGLGYTITPALNFNGTMALTYNVIDGNLGSIAASQSYAVTAVNDAPVGTATAVLAAGTEDTAYVVSAASLLAGFSDVDVGFVLSISGLSASNGAVVNNGNGTYTVTPTYNFNGTMGLNYNVVDGNGGVLAASQSYGVTAVIDVPNLDFDGDGKSDILWRNSATGADTIWKSGNSATAQATATVTDQNWKIAGTGDFDFDGKSDILWRNTVTGANTIWKAGNNLTAQAVATVADLNMKVVGTGDFNGDGTSDILWRNSVTGANTIWKGGDSASVQAVAGVANQDWKVVGTGDFDGNGTSDILWRNTATGANTIWKSGNSATGQAVTSVTDQNWKIAGTGDFNGDGKTDILWRNSVTGSDTIWRSGNSATAQAVATVADQNWKIAGTGDYDADGKADILWRNSVTGAGTIWKSGNNATMQAVATIADQNWSIVDGLETGDLLTGGAGNNTLHGTLRNDVLFGSTGRDTMTGSAGADTFVFTALNQSGITATSRDVITDFISGTDRIDLSGIDANMTTIANDAFTFIGTGAFLGGGAASAGQLRYGSVGGDTFVEGDVDGDGLADFQIQLTGNHTVTAADLVA